MKTIFQLLLLSIFFMACNTKQKQSEPEDSFLPMQIGNYWKIDSQNYTEIQDTVRLDGKLYYKFYALVGGDGVAITYLRIDEHNRLVESWPAANGKEYIRAQFNSKLGDSFFTLSDQSSNDYKVTVIEKTDKQMIFSLDRVHHDYLNEEPYKVTYVKGVGLQDRWKSIKINGKIIK